MAKVYVNDVEMDGTVHFKLIPGGGYSLQAISLSEKKAEAPPDAPPGPTGTTGPKP